MTEPTVSELFARDPLSLSSADIDKIIEHMRAGRKRFIQGDLTAGKPEAKKSAAQKKNEALAKEVGDINDLLGGLGL
jgi:hypothetical protein